MANGTVGRHRAPLGTSPARAARREDFARRSCLPGHDGREATIPAESLLAASERRGGPASSAGTHAARSLSMTDVLIVGGGIAGSALAILLGRQGLSVELFERGRFPKEKACGEGLMPAGVGVLERLGVAEAVGGAPFYGVRYHFGD